MKTRLFRGFIPVAVISFAWAAAYAGTAPNQPANLANVNTSCVSPVESPTPTPGSNTSCTVNYAVTSMWGNYFTATITIKNTSKTPVQGWTLRWGYTGNQTVVSAWNGSAVQSGKAVSVANADCDKTIPVGGTAVFGFLASYSGKNTNPTVFTLQ